ncbi:MAG: MFS transporter, partial [Verrucomicrobiota bacterium]
AIKSTEQMIIIGLENSEMYIMATLIVICQGGIQALSRSYFTSIIPLDKTTAYFGFYSMIGKSAAILGPLLMGFSALLFNDPEQPALSTRIGMGMLSVLFLLGAGFLILAGRSDQTRVSKN